MISGHAEWIVVDERIAQETVARLELEYAEATGCVDEKHNDGIRNRQISKTCP